MVLTVTLLGVMDTRELPPLPLVDAKPLDTELEPRLTVTLEEPGAGSLSVYSVPLCRMLTLLPGV